MEHLLVKHQILQNRNLSVSWSDYQQLLNAGALLDTYPNTSYILVSISAYNIVIVPTSGLMSVIHEVSFLSLEVFFFFFQFCDAVGESIIDGHNSYIV